MKCWLRNDENCSTCKDIEENPTPLEEYKKLVNTKLTELLQLINVFIIALEQTGTEHMKFKVSDFEALTKKLETIAKELGVKLD